MNCEANPIVSSFLTGTVSIRRGSESLQVFIDGIPQAPFPLSRERAFSVPLPSMVFDGRAHRIEVRLSGQERFRSSPLYFQSKYQGYVHMEPFAGPLLTGWAIDLARPGTTLRVEILLHGDPIATVPADQFRQDLLGLPAFSGKCGFSHAIEGEEQLDSSSILRARILGTHFDLRGSPVLYLDTSRYLKTLHRVNSAFRFLSDRTIGSAHPSGPGLDLREDERRTFAEMLLSSGNLAELMELGRSFQSAGLEHINSASHRHRFYTYLSESYAGTSVIPHRTAVEQVTDAIFHVHADAVPSRVAEALRRLLASPQEPAFSVICLLDVPPGSPCESAAFDAANEEQLDGRKIIFVQNPAPRGFAASVNAAAALNGDRDVVLLDCQTLVSGNWLGRLRSAADRSPAAGIATPFSTSGEICCYPSRGDADADGLCALANAGRLVDVPAVHGICSFVRRACLDEIGEFNETIFPSRTCAVADFCLRAGNRGWRTLLAADVLVESPPIAGHDETYSSTLDQSHPYYRDMLVNFRVDDPDLPLRRAIDVAFVKSLKRPLYCFLTHQFGGGTERHVRDLCAALADAGIECLVIFALDGSRASCVVPRLPSLASIHYDLEREYDSLVSDLASLSIQQVHIHSNIAIPQKLMQLPELLGVPYYCTIHDFSWFCPRVNLIDESGIYCGEPDVAVCNECIRQPDPGLWRDFTTTHQNVEDLRARSQAVLSGALKVFCPSRDTQLRMARQFQLKNLEVRRNLEPSAALSSAAPGNALSGPSAIPVGVALIGFISRKKGMDILRECAASALRDNLPLRFVVVGFTEDDRAFDGLSNVTITGRYEEGEAGSILRSHDLSLALFPIVWPETYSYTLSIALNCGLYPVAFDLGAIAERIRQIDFGHLLPLETSPEEINDALMTCSRLGQRRRPTPENQILPDVLDYYYGAVEASRGIGQSRATAST
jgi:glycosyltransferase involved in cell wall biosynthesis